MVELLFFPALVAYGEAAVAYAGDARHPGRGARFAVWGVRLGWLAQTALIVVQAASSDGFPWDTWAGSLNLFVWLVVGSYLMWGCRPRYRLLGLAVMPLAASLLLAAWVAGAAHEDASGSYPAAFLALHVGFVLIGFAGFTLAAAMSALYLWQERRVKRRTPARLLGRAPSLVTLDRLALRAVAVAVPALTLGVASGFVRLRGEGGGLDALMAATLATWAVYAAYLVVRVEAGWHGRRAAYLALAGFALVALVRLAVPLSHFGT